jgi:LuxR family maltose regulon positive regulatory protein
MSCVPGLASAQLLWTTLSHSKLEAWLDTAETALTASLTVQTHKDQPDTGLCSETQREQENLLGEVITFRALMQSLEEKRQQAVPALCQRALTLVSAENAIARVQVACAQLSYYYASLTNDAVASIKSGLQAVSLAQSSIRLTALTIDVMGGTVQHMIGTGQLHEAKQQAQQAVLLGTQYGEFLLAEVGWATVWLAEILREWNQIDDAYSLIAKAIPLCQQIRSFGSLHFVLGGYTVLLRICLSRGDLDAAYSALQQYNSLGKSMNQTVFTHLRSLFTTVDQVRLWLACGELDRATSWIEELDRGERHGTPFAREREEVACARILLAKDQPALALPRLEPMLQRARAGQRWGHVIEIRLLQARARQMCQQETQALEALSEAVRLAEPEGYIRSFVDEGASIEALLYQLRERARKQGPTAYLDTLLAAFQQESKVHVSVGERAKAQPLPELLSERELQVLQLLARGASNQEIAQELVIVIDTVKRHVSHIFSKLGVQNRIQAVRQARELGLLDEAH